MEKEVTLEMFIDAFKRMDRDYYSYEGYESLYDFFEECDPDWEYDVIGICCDYTEYNDLDDYNQQLTESEKFESIEQLSQETLVLETEKGSLIVENY